MNPLQILMDRVQGKAEKGQKRSSKWRKVRKKHITEFNYCESCGSDKKLEVHHIIPFNIAPDLELDPENLLTLCENKKYGINCHLFLGHNGNYRKFNINVKSDCDDTYRRIKE